MTKNKPTVTKLSDKLAKVGDSFTVSIYDNGFLFDVSGRDSEGDWASVKLVCNNLDDLVTLIMEAVDAERD